MVGSAFAIRVLGRNFLVSSLHQLGVGGIQRDPTEAVMVINTTTGPSSMTGNEANRVRVGLAGAETEQDVFILRVDDRRAGRDMTVDFCRLGSDQFMDRSEIPVGGKVLAYVVIGFPSMHRSYEFDWDEETSTVLPGDLRSRWVQVYLDDAEPCAWEKDGPVPFQIDIEQVNAIGALDGLSGSPILMVSQGPDLQTRRALAGMVLRASRSGRLNSFPGRLLGEILTNSAKPTEWRSTTRP
jgi:hypothetical protein